MLKDWFETKDPFSQKPLATIERSNALSGRDMLWVEFFDKSGLMLELRSEDATIKAYPTPDLENVSGDVISVVLGSRNGPEFMRPEARPVLLRSLLEQIVGHVSGQRS